MIRHSSDHVFANSDVIVREDEPSSLIAFALDSADYRSKLEKMRQSVKLNGPDPCDPSNHNHIHENQNDDDQALQKSLLNDKGTHLKYQFQEGSAKMFCKVFFAEQFDALRRNCSVADRYVESLSRCIKWDSKGGKTKSVFLKTLDDRIVLKQLSQVETTAFLKFAPSYFHIMSEALFHEVRLYCLYSPTTRFADFDCIVAYGYCEDVRILPNIYKKPSHRNGD